MSIGSGEIGMKEEKVNFRIFKVGKPEKQNLQAKTRYSIKIA